jgi:ABC-type uncharacterized transport system permease subunit
MITFTILYAILGTEGAFKPGEFNPSGTWVASTLVFSIVAAVIGGWVCALIARSVKTASILAGIVLVLGLIVAIPQITAEPSTEVRTGEVEGFQAMQKGQQPAWISLLNPFIGAAGIMLGARFRKSDDGAVRS